MGGEHFISRKKWAESASYQGSLSHVHLISLNQPDLPAFCLIKNIIACERGRSGNEAIALCVCVYTNTCGYINFTVIIFMSHDEACKPLS